jgi:hypothetical protein
VLQRLGLAVLIDPHKRLPDWLGNRERKLAKRGGMRPIWMPTKDMPFDVWRYVVSEFRNNEIIWSTCELPRKHGKKKTVH